MLSTIYLIALAIYLIYKYWIMNYDYWKKHGFPHIPASLPFGSSSALVMQNKFQGEAWTELYNKMSPHPFFGVYIMRTPFLVLRDPEAVRIVMAQSFQYFRDRQPFRRSREPLTNHLFNLEGEPWRALRVKLTATFTSGKLKGMFPLFESCSEALDSLLESSVNQVVDVKDITARFSTDIIGTCAFGLEMKSILNPDSDFRKVGIEIFSPKQSTKYKMALVNTFPSVTKLFSPRFTSEAVEKFILEAVKETIEYRTKNGIRRKDFIDLLLLLRSEESKSPGDIVEMTLEMMAAQCFVFFTAGFETSASVQSCCLYELALNQDIQDRLHDEIEHVIEKYGLTYDSIQKMSYLDMVVSETMRKYPTLPTLTRFSTQNFVMPTGQKIEKGVRIIIPVWALHHDSHFFPEPEKFNPERFSETNSASIRPFTFLPFGEGPRMCIGKRFGLLQTKMGLITFLKKYKVKPAENTPMPLKFSRLSLLITASDGPIPLMLTRRYGGSAL